MKLQVRTLDRQIFNITFSQFRTVEELKEYVCRLCYDPIHPDTQQLVYAGHALDDKNTLKHCCIDERRYLVMTNRPSKSKELLAKESNKSKDVRIASIANRTSKSSNSVRLGLKDCKSTDRHSGGGGVRSPIIARKPVLKLSDWPEKDVRRALLIALNDRERALHYLMNSERNFFPKMITPPPSDHSLRKGKKKVSFVDYSESEKRRYLTSQDSKMRLLKKSVINTS